MNACGKEISIQGSLVRVARVAAEGFEFADDPEATISALRNSGIRIDLFSFIQRKLTNAFAIVNFEQDHRWRGPQR